MPWQYATRLPYHAPIFSLSSRYLGCWGTSRCEPIQGVEGLLSQGVRACGLRTARYAGLATTRLQHLLTGAALNVARLAAWFAERPLATTRPSRVAALVA